MLGVSRVKNLVMARSVLSGQPCTVNLRGVCDAGCDREHSSAHFTQCTVGIGENRDDARVIAAPETAPESCRKNA
jgi:hypothetical protein